MENKSLQLRGGVAVLETSEDVMAYAELAVQSGILASFGGKVQNLALAVMTGMELGLRPSMAAQNSYVINGKVAFYGEATVALIGMTKKELGVTIQERFAGDPGASIYDQANQNAYWEAIISYPDGTTKTVTYGVQDAVAAGLWPVGTTPITVNGVTVNKLFRVGSKGMDIASPWCLNGKDMLWRKLQARISRAVGVPAGDIDDLEHIGELERAAPVKATGRLDMDIYDSSQYSDGEHVE